MHTDVGIVNAWGSNRGDEAMLSALLAHLRGNYPKATVTVYSNEILDLVRYNVKIEPWVRDLADYLPRSRFSAPFARVFRRAQLRARLSNINRGSKNPLKLHKLVISAPAGPYLGDMYPAVEPKCLGALLRAHEAGTPYAVMGVSAGPFRDSNWNKVRREILGNSEFVSVRERLSYDYVQSLAPNTEIYCGADLVFAHPVREVSAFLPLDTQGIYESALRSLDTPTILVSLNYTPYISPNGVSIPFRKDTYAEQMGELLAHARRRTDCQIMLIPHFYGNQREMENINSVIAKSNLGEAISVLHPSLNAEAQMSLFEKAAIVISHRYHPTIFAIRSGRPFMCIRHQFKVDGMLEMLGNTGPRVTSADGLADWIDAFNYAWDNREELQGLIAQKIAGIRAHATGHFEIFDRLLGTQLR